MSQSNGIDVNVQELTRLSQLPSGKHILVDLGLSASPSVEDVTRVFSEYARRFHPDRFASTGDERIRSMASRLFIMVKNAADSLREQVIHASPSSRVEAQRSPSTRSQESAEPDPSQQPACGKAATDSRSPYQEQPPRRRSSDSGVRSRVNPKLEAAQGKVAVNQKRYTEAVDHFSKAVLASPESAEYVAWLGWAKFLADKNDHATACGVLEKATRLDPRYALPWIYLGRISKMQGQQRKAIEYYEEALGIDPKNPEARSEVRLWERRRASSVGLEAAGTERREVKRTGSESRLGKTVRGFFGRMFKKRKKRGTGEGVGEGMGEGTGEGTGE